jgi:hemoglobin-like flavoprotein
MAHWHDADRPLRPAPEPAVAIATDDQIGRIRDSFDAIWPVHREIAEAFYARFFELVPDARRMFPDELEGQQRKLMDTIAALVGALDSPEMFQSIGSPIGRWHAQLGVTSSHLAAFGEALLWTLERHFASAFTPELRQAWAALYEAVQSDMMQAMEEEKLAMRTGGI